VKRGMAEMLKGGVIMDVVTPDQAKIAEDAGAVAVMALERVPADIRRDGGVARMSDPDMIDGIIEAVSIPVMAKARIGHFVEAQILEALGVDYVDESEVLTPADETHHIDKFAFTVPFVCGATNLGEALRRISEGACLIRSKGEAGTGNIVEAVRHLRNIIGDIRKIGQADSAEPLFRQALSEQPGLVAALYGLGRAALARRDYAHAIEYLEQVLAADPRASAAHYQLALAYRESGDTAKAEAHLKQRGTVEIGPPDPLLVEVRALLRGAAADEERGMRALENRDFKAAAEYFQRGLEAAPDNPSLRHKLGTALAQMGDISGAVAAFEETVRRTPNYPQAHYSLGVIAASTGRAQDAVRHLSDAIRYEQRYVEARLQLGEVLARSGQFEQARAQFKRVIEIDPSVADARFGYAGALVGLRRYAEAREVLSEAARLYPDQPRFGEALARLQGVGR